MLARLREMEELFVEASGSFKFIRDWLNLAVLACLSLPRYYCVLESFPVTEIALDPWLRMLGNSLLCYLGVIPELVPTDTT